MPKSTQSSFQTERSEITVTNLGSNDAARIASLERLTYPRAFWTGAEDFREDLEAAERRRENFSRGLINQRGELVAYLVAFVEESEETGDNVVYGSDLAVLPELQQQGLGGRLLIEVLKAARERGYTCEAHCRESSYKLLSEHPRVLFKIGYRLTTSKKLRRYNAGEDHWWIRLEPISVR